MLRRSARGGNHAAHHIYQKVSVVEEGQLRQGFHRDGRWYDQDVLGMLEGELRY
ncbi:hypothetical protein [Streptomyces sp. NPDC056291]|uniref:hypothetical protein n=1 Tax=Streptomyces sp. NPDC056291 TaxID=3345772 RepID=UPI0035E18C56